MMHGKWIWYFPFKKLHFKESEKKRAIKVYLFGAPCDKNFFTGFFSQRKYYLMLILTP